MARRAVNTESVDPRVTLNVLTAVKRGDFSARMPANWIGPAARVAAALNEIIESNQRLERELHRLSKRVGKEGQMKRAPLGDAGGAWASTLDAINDLIEDLARPNMEMGRVIRAVAAGDRADDATHLHVRPREVLDEVVDGVERARPCAARVA